jgi:hypothetical protein
MILRESVSAPVYIELLRDFIRHCNNVFEQGRWVLMQEGASAHTARQTRAYIERQCQTLPYWPANSPDLKPIEIV